MPPGGGPPPRPGQRVIPPLKIQSATDAFLRIPCTIVHVEDTGPDDEYGNATTTTTTTDTRCYLAQQIRREVGLTPVEVDRWLLYLPPGTQIDANDAVVIGPNTWQVIGDPWPVWHPVTLRVNHIEATVERRR